METMQRGSYSVLMFPWLAHGHISPFLELAKKLTKRNFHIYFCSTPINLNSIKPKLSPNYSLSIQFVELHLPSLPDLPPHYHTTKGLPPHLMTTLKKAFEMSSTNFFNILMSLKPDLLIYDFIQPWAPSLAASLNIPALHFLSTSTAVVCYVLHPIKNPSDHFPFASIYIHDNCLKTRLEQLPESSRDDDRHDLDRALQCFERSYDVMLVRTFRELEAKYIDYLSVLLKNKKMVPVGPLVEDLTNEEDEKMGVITQWLDKKEALSTVFVSFGSEYFLTKEEREEIAHGLELSKVNFIWVVRFPVGEKINLEEALPDGYLDRVKEMGLVIEEWAPQTKILGHSSIFGFVSHCGWGSVMESMKSGVPIIAMPMNLDQPINARVVEDVGVGVEVKRNEDGGLDRKEIAKTIRQVVVERRYQDVRRKATEMSHHISKKGEEEIDGVVDELVRICASRSKLL